MAWIAPKTNWSAADGVRDSDFNRIEGNTLELYNTKARQDEFEALKTRVNNGLFDIAQRTAIGNIGIGIEIGLYENSVLVPFIKLSNNYEGTGRNLVVRKDAYKMDVLFNTADTYYSNSKQDTWLNNSYLQLLDQLTQNVITPVSIEVLSDVGTGTIDRRAFILSLGEYNQDTAQGISWLGEGITYFSSNARRVARFNGNIVPHWTRSVHAVSPRTAACISTTGDGSGSLQVATTYSAGIRPAFTLPPDFEVIGSIPSTANIMAIAEVV